MKKEKKQFEKQLFYFASFFFVVVLLAPWALQTSLSPSMQIKKK